ncbi:DUF29 domain-containing protein [Photorhabdus luminescens]|uniref:DUF29 domain-containing protein n=1 Tax=Photorhabdus luminescens TaxID=29488 RepID=UPI002240A81D|nr:DUF29 domain-containing protein [Photorhabdus luminescens]MCW7761437.1 DUF29 domain-containing protein [Photorhabdus luminescens subsp. venezuelensis]
MTTRYDSDFYGWTREQAGLLRSGNLNQLDRENLSEEIESMGNSQRNELESLLEVLFLHLLKWQFQSERQYRSWKLTIEGQRRKIVRRLKKNPSLKSELSEISSDAYGDAIIAAERETNIRRSVFPETCPWTFEQIMDEKFWPE